MEEPILPHNYRSWSAIVYNLKHNAKRAVMSQSQIWLKANSIILIYNADCESFLLERYDGGSWEKETLIEYGKVLFPAKASFACVALRTASGVRHRKNEAELTAKTDIRDGFEILWRYTCTQ